MGTGKPLQLQIAVLATNASGVITTTVLSPKQTLYSAPYAVATGSANHSGTDFTVNGALSTSGNASITGVLNLFGNALSFFFNGDLPAGISYRAFFTPDALTITGAGIAIGQRLIRLLDNVIVTGNVGLQLGGLTPAIDTGWFAVDNNNNATVNPPLNNSPSNTPATAAPPSSRLLIATAIKTSSSIISRATSIRTS